MIRIQFVIAVPRKKQQTVDVQLEDATEVIDRFGENVNWGLVKGLMVTLTGEHLLYVKQYMTWVRMCEMEKVTWSGEDAVFILNNLRGGI